MRAGLEGAQPLPPRAEPLAGLLLPLRGRRA